MVENYNKNLQVTETPKMIKFVVELLEKACLKENVGDSIH